MLAVALVGVGAAVAVWWARPDSRAAASSAATTVSATVTKAAPCSAPDARDGVEYQLAGKTQQAQLDGCGHLKGAELTIEVPAGSAALVREASTNSGNGGFGDRLYVILLVLAALAGAGYALLLGGSLQTRNA